MKEIDLVIDTEEIAEFFYRELARRGYIPSEDELFEKCSCDALSSLHAWIRG